MLLRPLDERSTAVSQLPMLPAPTGGIDQSVSVLEGRPRKAQRLINFCARTDGLHSRSGQTRWATGLPGAVESFVQLAGEAVFACTGGEIWEIKHNVKIRHSTGHLANRWLADTIPNPGVKAMVAANGLDAARVYVNGVFRAATITNVDPATLAAPVWYANRIFFYQRNTQELWYLKPGAYEGPASPLPLAGLLQNEAPIVALSTAPGGPTGNMLVAITAWGELIALAGTDPDMSTSWQKVGVYSTAMPLGWRPFALVNGQLNVLTSVGVIDLRTIIGSDKQSVGQKPLSAAIYKTYDTWANYAGHANWQLIECSADKGVVLLNWPQTSPHLNSNGAWSETLGMSATAWADDGSITYRGTANGEVWQYGTSSHDDGAPIDLLAISHYQRLGGRRVSIGRARASMRSVPVSYHLGILTDYAEVKADVPFPTLPAAAGQPQWNFPWDPPTSFQTPKESEINEWRLASGNGTAFASVFAARTHAPLLYRGVDLMQKTGGQV